MGTCMPKYVEKRNKYTKQNCAPSWIYSRVCTGMHGQQNTKYPVIWRCMKPGPKNHAAGVLITLLRPTVTCCKCWSLCYDVRWRVVCANHFVGTFGDVLQVMITLLGRSVTCCKCWSLCCDFRWRAVCADHFVGTFGDVLQVMITLLRRSLTCCVCYRLFVCFALCWPTGLPSSVCL